MFDDLSDLARGLGRGAGRLKRELDRKIGKTDRPMIVPYRGYGNDTMAYVSGRVVLDPGLTSAAHDELWWKNLLNTYKRAGTDELANARLIARGLGAQVEVTSDQEGFFQAELPVRERAAGQLWHSVDLVLMSPLAADQQPALAIEPVLIPPADAQYGVISDLDDTVIQTGVSSIPRMIRAVALGNAHTRLPFQGVAAFYQALHLGTRGRPANPIFYVSSSPWNLYDLLEEFMSIRGIPAGPMMLRDWGLGVNLSQNARHKTSAIKQIIDTYPKLPFILIGDSSQEDPEIYRVIVGHYPKRILAVYIRNVAAHPERSAAIKKLIAEVVNSGAIMMLTDDTLTAARHALEQNWIAPEALAEIVKDESREDKKEPAPESEAGPAIVVEGKEEPPDLPA